MSWLNSPTVQRERKSVWSLSPEEVDNLKKAFRTLMYERAWDDPNSYFTIAGFHGIATDVCQHHIISFLGWHKMYVRIFEDALRTVEGCENVTLPYLDIPSQIMKEKGLPDWCYEEPFLSFDMNRVKNLTPQQLAEMAAHAEDLWNDGVTRRINNETLIKFLKNGDDASMDTLQDWINKAMLSTRVSDVAILPGDSLPKKTSFESPHDNIHWLFGNEGKPLPEGPSWIGDPRLSAFDPIFWFHHSNVERWWSQWQHHQEATTRDGLETKRGNTKIPWDTPFPRKAKSALLWSRKAFKGSLGQQDAIWQEDVGYEAEVPVKEAAVAPQNLLIGSIVGAANNITVEPAKQSLIVKNIDRSRIRGSFTVKVSSGDRVIARWFAFQKGLDCENCNTNKFISFVQEIEPITERSNLKISLTSITGKPITNFGTPSVGLLS